MENIDDLTELLKQLVQQTEGLEQERVATAFNIVSSLMEKLDNGIKGVVLNTGKVIEPDPLPENMSEFQHAINEYNILSRTKYSVTPPKNGIK